MGLAPHSHENMKQPINIMEEGELNPKNPKLPPSLTFYNLWLKIQTLM